MRTTDVAGEGDRDGRRWRSHRLVSLVAALAIAVAIASLTNFAVGAHATLSDVAWHDFGSTGQVDCLFVGSSYAQRAFDPTVFDAETGTHSVNLSTPGQVMGDTYDAVSTAISEKGTRHVVLGLGIVSFYDSGDVWSHVPYVMARDDRHPVACTRAMLEIALNPRVIGTAKSVNVLFPWTFTPVKSIPGILANMRAKVTGEAYSSAAEKTTPGWHYVGQGYGNYGDPIDRSNGMTTLSAYGNPHVDEQCLANLVRVCDLCRERGVRLTVVATPHPAYDLLAIGNAYPEIMSRVQSVAEEHGATYWDLSMVDGGELDLGMDDFGDYEHLNLDGARKATGCLARLIAEQDAGGDVDRHFIPYGEWDRWVEQAKASDTGKGGGR